MSERRHRAAFEQAHAAVTLGPSRQPLPTEFRPRAESPRHGRKALLEDAPRPRLGAEMVDEDDLAARLSSAASGSGTVVMTYCATTASKKASGKPRCCASITANASTWASLCSATRSCALRNIGSQ